LTQGPAVRRAGKYRMVLVHDAVRKERNRHFQDIVMLFVLEFHLVLGLDASGLSARYIG